MRRLLGALRECLHSQDARRWIWALGAVYAALAGGAALRLDVEWIVLGLLIASAVFIIAAATALHGRVTPGVGRIVAAALAFRLLFLFLTPSLSDDVWRYLWDGEVARAGINPYAHAPDDAALIPLRDEVWSRVNHRSIPTIYPPAAQLLFRAAAQAGGLGAWKILVLAFDVTTMLALARGLHAAGRPAAMLAFYAWNPLVLVELTWNAHVDVAATALLVGAVVASLAQRQRAATALASVAAGIKLYPALVLPLFLRRAGLRRTWWIPVAIGAALGAPYLDAGWHALVAALGVYARDWEFNGFVYEQLRRAAFGSGAARSLLLGLVIAVASVATARVRSVADAVLWIVFALVALNPTIHPWYVMWLVPLAVLASGPPRLTALVLSLAVSSSYVVLAVREATGRWFLPDAWMRLEWWPVIATFVVELGCWAGARARRKQPMNSVDD